MSKKFAKHWQRWWQRHDDRRQRNEPLEQVRIPFRGIEKAAKCLLYIHAGLRTGVIDKCLSGPLTNTVIQSWIPKNRFVSREALDHIKNDGDDRELTDEHDPPTSLIRDYIRRKKVSVNTLRAILRGTRVTIITTKENTRLEKAGYKSERPPDAYEDKRVRIKPCDYALYENAIAARRVRRRKAKRNSRGGRLATSTTPAGAKAKQHLSSNSIRKEAARLRK